MIWFWYFLFYSFGGFLLEVVFAALTGGRPERKTMLVLPLCPVYGLGACSVTAAVGALSPPPLIFLAGAVLATAWEYIMAAFYGEVLGVAFWDYSDLPLNVHGRICLPFSAAWGFLSVPLVTWLHPLVEAFPFSPPPAVTALMAAAFGCDFLLTCLLLAKTGDIGILRWYREA